MIICIDFDGVLNSYRSGWNNGILVDEPVPGAKEAMRTLKREGHHLIIFSCRGSYEHMTIAMEDWLAKHEIVYDSIWQGVGKPMADIYLDDRAVQFKGNWKDSLKDISEYKNWLPNHMIDYKS